MIGIVASSFWNKDIVVSIYILFVTSKNEFSNSPIHKFKVLQNVFKIKKTSLKMFFKVINNN